MDPDESRIEPRRNVEDLQTVLKHEQELDTLKDHYENVIKKKEIRYDKANSTVRLLEEENEGIKSEIDDLKKENKRIQTMFKELNLTGSEAGARHEIEMENLQKKYDDLKKLVDGWTNMDLSKLLDGDIVNEEHVKKKFQSYIIENRLHQEEIRTSRDIITSLESQLELQNNMRQLQKPESTVARWFGHGKELEKLKAENAFLQSKLGEMLARVKGISNIKDILKDEYTSLRNKEQSVTKLIKGHQLRMENQENIISELRQRLTNEDEKNKVKNTKQNDLLTELEEAKVVIEKKDLAIIKMKERIENLLEANKTSNDEVLTRENHILNGKLNNAVLEYEQMELKYQNAFKEVQTLLEWKAAQKSATPPPERSDVASGTSDDTFSEFILVPQVDIQNASRPDEYITKIDGPKGQVCDMPVDMVTCPNCNDNFQSSEVESHLNACLETFN